LKETDRWVLWNLEERRGGRLTKVPYQAARPVVRADATEAATWAPFTRALDAYESGKSDGIGFVLGGGVFGFDADACRDPQTGIIAPEPNDLFRLLNTYTEVSPRACGLKAIGRGTKPGPLCRRGAFELYDTARFFCMTGHRVPDFSGEVEDRQEEVSRLYARLFPATCSPRSGPSTADNIPADDVELIRRAHAAEDGHKFDALWNGNLSAYDHDASRADLVLYAMLARWTGGEATRIDRLFRRSKLYRAKWDTPRGTSTYGALTIQKALAGYANRQGVTLADFHAYMPMHASILGPSGEVWPSTSVNARLPPVPLLDAAGQPILDDKGKPKRLTASDWLDQHRPVEQMTWLPGSPRLIRNRFVSDGGWIDRPGCTVFNLYRPPAPIDGDAERADRWLSHVRLVFPDDHAHVVARLAHRVQRPHEKLNHALVLGGLQGVGKDTILEPVKAAVGPWNFQEVSPGHLLGRFNGFVKAVILRVSEAGDLGDVDRYSFYDHLKTYTAAPPDVLRVDEKNLREYVVWNVCGVVITTNHKMDGLYLPADDRRHYVAWSSLTKEAFPANYWTQLYAWYAAGGTGHVAAFLRAYDLGGFDPKAPPPKTAAFYDIVDANRAPEDAELADALDCSTTRRRRVGHDYRDLADAAGPQRLAARSPECPADSPSDGSGGLCPHPQRRGQGWAVGHREARAGSLRQA
jgi:hypothetical protein